MNSYCIVTNTEILNFYSTGSGGNGIEFYGNRVGMGKPGQNSRRDIQAQLTGSRLAPVQSAIGLP